MAMRIGGQPRRDAGRIMRALVLEPAMPASFPSETRTYTDRVTGVTVHQLTDYLAHSYHVYFTNPGWWDGGRRLLFGSERGNRSDLYSLDHATGEITRLTEGTDRDMDFQTASVNLVRDEAYQWHRGSLFAFDLPRGTHRILYTCPDGWAASGSSATADGKYIVSVLKEKVDVGPVDLANGYVGFRAVFEARALHRLVRIPLDGDSYEPEVLHEERNWLGHINPSPTRPNLITYCYEGPWALVGQRMWGFDLETRQRWKIRPQEPGELIGHEYWMADGVTVGYHGRRGGEAVFGYRRYDNEGAVEVAFPAESNHFHSHAPDLIVGDGLSSERTPYVLLCRFNGEQFEGPRVLCIHRGSQHIQHLHVHPRFTPDGKKVLFTADPRGYGQLFLAELPPFESLPTLAEVVAKRDLG